jgi:hypothetical protein
MDFIVVNVAESSKILCRVWATFLMLQDMVKFQMASWVRRGFHTMMPTASGPGAAVFVALKHLYSTASSLSP